MGQARIRELSAKAVAFSKSDMCIYCAGSAIADTVEHYLPRSIFSENKWPEKYVFPACRSCNFATREEDQLVAFLSRLDPQEPKNQADSERTAALFRSLCRKYPNEMASMFDITSVQAKRLAVRLGMKPAPGELYRDMPFMHLPEMVHKAVEVFAIKMTKTLHFHHTGLTVPAVYGFKHRWFTNASYMEGKIPEEIFTIPAVVPVLRRSNVDLSDQFSYRYTVSADGQLGMYTVMLRFAFCFTAVLSFDSSVINSE